MADWQDIMNAPYWVDIRARYKDGRETVGQFYQTDIENVWWDKDDKRGEKNVDEWPSEWAPITESVITQSSP